MPKENHVWNTEEERLKKLWFTKKLQRMFECRSLSTLHIFPSLLMSLAWIQEYEVISDEISKLTSAWGINPRKILALIDALDHFIGWRDTVDLLSISTFDSGIQANCPGGAYRLFFQPQLGWICFDIGISTKFDRIKSRNLFHYP